MAPQKKGQQQVDEIDEILTQLKSELGTASENKVESYISTGSTLLDMAISNRIDGRCSLSVEL